MNYRENSLAILHYQPYEALPVVHFGYWNETLLKWCEQGHITKEEALGWGDGNAFDRTIAAKLGFDFNWYSTFGGNSALDPVFETKLLEVLPNGQEKVVNPDGVCLLYTSRCV